MRNLNIKRLVILILIIIVIVVILFKACGGKSGNTTQIQTETNESGEIIIVNSTEVIEEAINTLIKRYRAACISLDENALKDIYNSSQVMDFEVIKEMKKYITGYTDTSCTIKQGANDHSYVVFVKDYITLVGINTPAPSLSTLYVIRDELGKYYIYPGEFSNTSGSYYYDTDISAAISSALSEQDIISLVAKVNSEFMDACNKDASLKALSEEIGLSINSAQKADAEAETAVPDTEIQSISETETTAQ